MKKIFIFLLAFSLPGSLLKSQNFEWAVGIGSNTTFDKGTAIAYDGNENVYTIGYFGGTVDFDPGSSVFNLTSGNAQDVFLAKYDSAGNFIWAKQFTGVNTQRHPFAVDQQGSIYITGQFMATVDIDPGAGVLNLTSSGGSDVFICKLDANGNLIWGRNIGGSGFDDAASLDIDTSGNIYFTGTFNSTADFDPGAGTFNLTTTNSWQAVFACKLDSNGNFVWAKNFGDGAVMYVTDIQCDQQNNIFFSGNYNGTCDFDPGAGVTNLTSVGNLDIYVCKLDASGNFIWAKSVGGSSYDQVFSISTDTNGNLYYSGEFTSTADLDPGSGTYSLTASWNKATFVSRLSSTGSFVWAKMFDPGFEYFKAYSIIAADNNNFFMTGLFSGTKDFDAGAGTQNQTASPTNYPDTTDLFVTKYNNNGTFVWVKTVDATVGNCVFAKNEGSVYLCGSFNGQTDFDPDTSNFILTPTTNADGFLMKFSDPLPCTFPSSVVATFTSCTNNCSGTATINYSGCNNGPYTAEWYINGNLVMTETFSNTPYVADSLCCSQNSYAVVIYDNLGNNIATIQVAATCPAPPLVIKQITNSSCSGTCDGEVQLQISGEYPPFYVNFSPALPGFPSTTDSASGLCAGNYTLTVTNNIGCTTAQTVAISAQTTVDTSVTVSGATLTANAFTPNYQWLDCNNGFAVIPGETSQVFTATVNGSYAVKVDQNGCADTSSCYMITTVGLAESLSNSLQIHPVPAKDFIVIENFGQGETISVFDCSGRLVLMQNSTAVINIVDVASLENGVYIIEVSQSSTMIRKKILISH